MAPVVTSSDTQHPQALGAALQPDRHMGDCQREGASEEQQPCLSWAVGPGMVPFPLTSDLGLEGPNGGSDTRCVSLGPGCSACCWLGQELGTSILCQRVSLGWDTRDKSRGVREGEEMQVKVKSHERGMVAEAWEQL